MVLVVELLLRVMIKGDGGDGGTGKKGRNMLGKLLVRVRDEILKPAVAEKELKE
jgi:predicted NAD-dependent protein-ADP-ribosyltransferase YbiA (DUF1768 family)